MKNALIALLLATTLVFGGLYARQLGRTRQAEAAVTSLNERVEEVQTQAAEKEQQATTLQTRLQNTRAKVIAKADEVVQLQQVITNQAATNARSGNPLAEMFKSPEMKDLIKTQQKAVLGTMIDKNYAPFFTSMQLTPPQATTLKDLITKRSLVDANMGISMLSGDMDADKRKELVQQAKTEKEGVDAEIKQFIGDANFTQLESYEKTMPDRMAINSFKDQAGPGALTPDQEQQLLAAMTDERQKFKFTTDFNDKSKFDGDFASFFTEEKLATFQTEREQLDKLYLARAQGILPPEQVGSFEKFLTGQRDLQTAGMKMAVKMFGGKSGGN